MAQRNHTFTPEELSLAMKLHEESDSPRTYMGSGKRRWDDMSDQYQFRKLTEARTHLNRTATAPLQMNDRVTAKEVEFLVDQIGKLWVNVDGVCVLRVGNPELVNIEVSARPQDHRMNMENGGNQIKIVLDRRSQADGACFPPYDRY